MSIKVGKKIVASGRASLETDNNTIIKNSNDKIQAVGITDQNNPTIAIRTWTGTRSTYDSISVKDPSTEYFITDTGELYKGTEKIANKSYTAEQIDAAVVHKTGNLNESITGTKTFTNDIKITTALGVSGNGLNLNDTNLNGSGQFLTYRTTDAIVTRMLASNTAANKNDYMDVWVYDDGTVKTRAPEPSATSGIVDSRIATVGWTNDPDKSINVVHKSGNEIIAGSKTFTGTVAQTDSTTDTGITLIDSVADYTAQPAENRLRSFRAVDKNNKILGDVRFTRSTNGTQSTTLVARNNITGTETNCTLSCNVDASGNISANAPIPSASSNTADSRIATIGWVSDSTKSANVVHRDSAETISGVKTFSSVQKGTKPGASNSTSSTDIPTVGWVNDPSTSTNIVHRSGDETIAGTKTFSTQIIASAGQGIRINGTNHYYVLRSSGSTSEGAGLLLDNNTANFAFNAGDTKVTIGGGTVLPHSVTPSTSDNSTRIATTAYVKAQDYVPRSSFSECHVITQTYKSGNNWYRVWSDGWIEQGGKGFSLSNAATITFAKSFTTTDYTLVTGAGNNTNTSKNEGHVNTYNRTKTSFQMWWMSASASCMEWYACGF